MGLRFLRHIERNSVLLFVIPADSDDIAAEYGILLEELRKYNPELLDKKRLLAISKADLLDAELTEALKKELPEGVHSLFISAATQEGLTTLKDTLWRLLHDGEPAF